MQKQITPKQIKSRIEQVVNEQKAKGFKPGWVYYQMVKICNAKAAHLVTYDYQMYDCYIASLAVKVAKGEETSRGMMENLEALYHQYESTQEMFS